MEKNNTNDWHGAQNKGKKDSLNKGFYFEPKVGGRVRICGFYNITYLPVDDIKRLFILLCTSKARHN